MKIKDVFLGAIFLCGTLLIPMINGLKYFPLQERQSPLEQLENKFRSDLKEFDEEIDQLLKSAQNYARDGKGLPQLRQQLIVTRLAYKNIEHMAEYFQPGAVKNYINGAPLPKIDPTIPTVEVIPPSGLQTLDEAIFASEVDGPAVVDLAQKLQYAAHDLLAYLNTQEFQHRYIFEAVRYQILRIYMLGLTGFDTPGSVNAVEESIQSLEALKYYIQAYYNMAKGYRSHYRTAHYLKEAINYLKVNDDFDTLDRLFILRNFINPLYTSIYDLQKDLQVEFVDEVDPTQHALNYHTQQIFSDSFLNPSYYAEIAGLDLNDSKKIALGKLLFFDPVLSKDIKMSCSSCHHPDKAFTDGLSKSRSNTPGVFTQRNAPTLINSVYAEKYFWDLREYDLERQVKHVVYDHNEFNMEFTDLTDRLKESEEYLALFKEAYGDRDKYIISTWSISNALAAYVSSLRSWNSPFDLYVRGELDQIEPEVQKGFNLFMGKAACGTCHFPPTFNGTVPPLYQESESEVLGVTTEFDTIHPQLDPDPGRAMNMIPRDETSHLLHSFKTMTVRNAALTAPYMHNGAFETLEEVMIFYNKGGGAGLGLDLVHQTLPSEPMNLSKSEQESIIAFIRSLTDTSGMNSPPHTLPEFKMQPEWNDRRPAY